MAPVLIVSHEPAVASFIATALSQAGYAVTTAASGPKALQAAVRDEYAIVIVEILMPDFDGIETILNLRRGSCRAPIIGLSGEGRVVSASEALRLARAVGADATLAMPCSGDEIAGVISTVLAQANAKA
jgi:two-component system OmpR family response regulator